MTFYRTAAALVLLAASCFAAEVDGKWTGTMVTPAGETPVNFTFLADGGTLTGSTTGRDGSELKIANGKTAGNNISFTVTVEFGGMPLILNYKGVVAAGEIKLTMEVMGMPFELTVKKAG